VSRGRSSLSVTIWHIVLLISFGGIVAALTILFRAMRSVMAIGGTCASGGPYQIAVSCPDGVPVLLNGAIWGGVILLFVALVATSRTGAPNIIWLLWPALFISLGYNFIDFGMNPPDGSGTESGWISCGVVFLIMGGGPLLFMIPLIRDGRKNRKRGAELAERALTATTRLRNAMTPPNVNVTAVPFRPETPRVAPQGPPPTIVADLERLAALHHAGALSASEYDAAKRMLLTGALS